MRKFLEKYTKFFKKVKFVDIKEFEITKAVITVFWKAQPYIFTYETEFRFRDGYEPILVPVDLDVSRFLKGGVFRIKSTPNSYEVIYKEQLTQPILVEYTKYKKRYRRNCTSFLGRTKYSNFVSDF